MSEFFGIEVAPGEPAYFCPDDTLRSVRLRRATLLMLDDTTEPTRVVVKCRVDRGPSFTLASLVPRQSESVALDVVFTEDVRISVSVITASAAAAADADANYAVHLTGNVNDETFEFGDGDEEDDDDASSGSESEPEPEDVPATHASDGETTDRGSESESWGSDLDEDGEVGGEAEGLATGVVTGGTKGTRDTENDAAARAAAALTGSESNRWLDPVADVKKGGLKNMAKTQSALYKWDAPSSSTWAFHLQTAGAKHHRRSLICPKFKWTGDLRPHLVSPRRQVPSLQKGWLSPIPDYAQSGWPDTEFNSPLQRKLEVKSSVQIEKMRASCRLARHVMDCVARAVGVGVTTDDLDRICHVVTVSNGAYPSPRNYMGFPKSICTSVNETVCHGIPDARALQAGDIVNLDVTVCLDGYHGDLNETYGVGFGGIRAGGTTLEDRKKHAEAEESIKLMRCALGCLQDAIALCKPGTRFRDLGEVIQQRADSDGFGVVKDFCGHGIGTLFHCAPNVPHYAGNKAVGAMQPGMTFTIEPMVNAGTRKCVTWPDGWTAVTMDGKKSAQYEHTLLITATGVEVLTARTETSAPLW